MLSGSFLFLITPAPFGQPHGTTLSYETGLDMVTHFRHKPDISPINFDRQIVQKRGMPGETGGF